MEKIKVYKLAQELDITSKEVLTFLHDKGIEVKVAQSSVEEDAALMVRKAFSTAGGSQEKKAELQGTEMKNTNEAAAEPPKKKKKIIVVSNPQNSNIQGQKKKGPERNQGTGGKSQNAGGNRQYQPSQNKNAQSQGTNYGQQQRQQSGRPQQPRQEVPHKIIRPLTAPSVPDNTPIERKKPVYTDRPRQQEHEPKIVQEEKAVRTVSENTESRQEVKKEAGAVRPAYDKAQQGSERKNTRPAGTDNRSNPRYGGGNQNNRSNQTGGGQNSGGYQNRGGGQNSGGGRYGGGTQGGGQNSGGYQNRGGQNSGGGRYGGGTQGGGQSSGGYQNRGGQDNRGGGRFGGGNTGAYGDKGNAASVRGKKPVAGKGFTADVPVKETEKHRDEEKRRISQERDRKSKKDFIYDNEKTKNKAGRFIKPEKKVEEVKEEQIKVIELPETLTIKELADKMKMQPSVIIKKLFLQGQIVTVNTDITYEEAENIAIEYEIMCEKEIQIDVIEELLKEDAEAEAEMTARPPVICVMGHVDHGKTSLLDAIRKTHVIDKEAGGITQHIGAYMVKVRDQKITFLDTPGHEAFTAMRMRGANATDIAILVVAADDGVMPQTVEAINHAKAAGIEIVVAVNKIDKPGANIDRVKQEMTEYELIPTDWGGSTEYVPVSAKTGEGMEDLLETILLTAEIMELKSNANRMARGLVIEAELDRGRGPVATVLVQKGTLHVGDFVSAGASHGKVRAMIDDKGRRVKEALPSTPVEILGLSDVPSAGEVFIAHENDKTAKNYAETYLAQNKVKMLEDTKAKMSLDDLFTQIQAGNLKELNIIVKADVQGSVEAVKQSLMKLSNEEVVVKCIHGGVGAISESDVSLAATSSAIIIGFNVRPDVTAKSIAEREGVDIKLYKVIYQAIEDIEAAMKGMLDPVFEEKVLGHAEVRQIFKASAIGNIAGSYVLDGMFQRGCQVRITRGETQIFEGELASLKRFKDDVKEVKAGYECGLVFDGFDQIQEMDIVEAYTMVEVPR